jgi:hypothetical protein
MHTNRRHFTFSHTRISILSFEFPVEHFRPSQGFALYFYTAVGEPTSFPMKAVQAISRLLSCDHLPCTTAVVSMSVQIIIFDRVGFLQLD